MINGNFQVSNKIKRGNFNVIVSFDTELDEFREHVVSISDKKNNGAAGIEYAVTGSGYNYNITFTIPEGVAGAFELGLTGRVRRKGEIRREHVNISSITINYNTIRRVGVRLGEINRIGG